MKFPNLHQDKELFLDDPSSPTLYPPPLPAILAYHSLVKLSSLPVARPLFHLQT